MARLRALGMPVVAGPAHRLVAEGTRVVGWRSPTRWCPPTPWSSRAWSTPRSALLAGLDLGVTDIEMMGTVVARAVPADPMGRTTVPRVWVAGNVTDPMAQVVMAAAAGTRVGAVVNAELVSEDVERQLTAVG